MECYHIILENVRKCWDQKVSVEYKFPLQWNIFKVVNGGQGEIILKSEVANFFDLHSNGKTDLASYKNCECIIFSIRILDIIIHHTQYTPFQ